MADIIVAGNTSGSITISAPLVAGSGVLTLPTGTDTLIGKATTDTLTNKSIAATQLTGTIAAAALPAGTVLQVVSSTKTDTFTSATLGWLDVTGLSVSITPRSTSSKIMVFGRTTGAGTSGGTRMQMRLVRDATSISIGDAAGIRLQVSGNEIYGNNIDSDIYLGSTAFYLDSPATTSASTYKIQVLNGNATNTIYINRTQNDSNAGVTPRGTSSITVMEIQG
jgi:hypothetical protein